jgi:hypothetical protein
LLLYEFRDKLDTKPFLSVNLFSPPQSFFSTPLSES